MASVELEVLDRFPAGTRVQVVPALTDRYSGGAAVWSGKVPADGKVKVNGLEDFGLYFLTDGERATKFQAKPEGFRNPSRFTVAATNEERGRASRAAAKLSRENVGSLTSSPAPDQTTRRLGSRWADRDEDVRKAEVRQEGEPLPRRNQLDESKALQRSDTPFGEVHEKEKVEAQPKLRQDQVPANTVQRSATPFGEATPKDKGEQQPFARQEDAPKGLLQRSATPEGSVTPKPRKGEVREFQRDVESSQAKAEGRTQEKPLSAVKKTSKATPVTKASPKKGAGKDRDPSDVPSP